MAPTWTEPITIYINGTDRTSYIARNSISIEETAATRGHAHRTLKMDVLDGGSIGLDDWQQIIIEDDSGDRIFLGVIVDKKEQQRQDQQLDYAITCHGWSRKMAHPEDLIDDTYSSQTDAAIIQSVLATTNPDIETDTYVEPILSGLNKAYDLKTGAEVVEELSKEANAVWYVDDGPADAPITGTSDLIANGTFESVTGDDFDNWAEVTSDGNVEDEGSNVHGGSHAVKLTAGASVDSLIRQNVSTVKPGERYQLTFWARGDGTHSLRYQIWDQTNGAGIVAITDTEVTATSYSQQTVYFTVPHDCTTIRPDFYCPDTDTGVAYLDDVTLKKCYQCYLHYFLSPLHEDANLVANGDFETAGAGGADHFSDWGEQDSDGAVEDETTNVNGGGHAAKITAGSSTDSHVRGTLTVIAGRDYTLDFYTRGDGTYEGRYYLYDLSNSAVITAPTATGVSGASYTQVTHDWTAPAGCTSAQLRLYCPATDTGIAYFDDVAVYANLDAEWQLLADTSRSDGAYYTDLVKINKAPEANRIIVEGSGTISRTVTKGSESDYGGWLTTVYRNKDIGSNAEADAIGAAILETKAANPSYTLQAYRHGIRAGQIVELTNSIRSLTSTRLDVKKVTTDWHGVHDGTNWHTTVKLELGKFMPDFADAVRNAAGKPAKDLEWEIDGHDHTNPNTESGGAHTHSQSDTGAGSAHDHGLNPTYLTISHCHTGETDTVDGHKHTLAIDTYYFVPGSNVIRLLTMDTESAHTHSNPDTDSDGAHTHSQGNTGDYTV